MTLATLREVLNPARAGGYAVLGVVVLGWEDARAYVRAAELQGAPIILQAGPGCRAHTPLPVLAAMFRSLAEQATVPVVAHLDHGSTLEECAEGVACGFTSVMYDGSSLPLSENIRQTHEVVALAHAAGVSVEGEVGFVGYDGGASSKASCPEEVARFTRETGVDAVAISVGNVHLRQQKASVIEYGTIARIEALTATPLVLHGGSGITLEDRQRLAVTTQVCKFNVGTELRMCFGRALRRAVAERPECFDRVALLKDTEAPLVALTRSLVENVSSKEGARGLGVLASSRSIREI